MSAARPPSRWQEEKSPTPWWCGTEDGEITLSVLAASEAPLEALIWKSGKDEHVSKSVKTSESCSNRQETMLFWISYVSNQDFVPCS